MTISISGLYDVGIPDDEWEEDEEIEEDEEEDEDEDTEESVGVSSHTVPTVAITSSLALVVVVGIAFIIYGIALNKKEKAKEDIDL